MMITFIYCSFGLIPQIKVGEKSRWKSMIRKIVSRPSINWYWILIWIWNRERNRSIEQLLIEFDSIAFFYRIQYQVSTKLFHIWNAVILIFHPIYILCTFTHKCAFFLHDLLRSVKLRIRTWCLFDVRFYFFTCSNLAPIAIDLADGMSLIWNFSFFNVSLFWELDSKETFRKEISNKEKLI